MRALFLFFALICACDCSCIFYGDQFYSIIQVRDCIEAIPFSEKVRQDTIDNALKNYQLYVFKDIVRDSPSSELNHIAVDIESGTQRLWMKSENFPELEGMRTKNYSNDFQFQRDIGNLVYKVDYTFNESSS